MVKGSEPVALIDTRTFAVRTPAEAAAEDQDSTSIVPWLAGGIATLLLGAAVARTLRRRRLATSHWHRRALWPGRWARLTSL